MRELTSWSSGTADPEQFPYHVVVAEFNRVGKHFVDKELLARLARVRVQVTARTPAAHPLSAFLDVALDKWDARYDYRSYLALPLLPLPTTTAPARPRDQVPAGQHAPATPDSQHAPAGADRQHGLAGPGAGTADGASATGSWSTSSPMPSPSSWPPRPASPTCSPSSGRGRPW